MLVQFSVENYMTFRNKATLSLVASNYDRKTRESENVIREEQFRLRLLRSAAIYGANASGKTKLLEALLFVRNFILTSSKEGQNGDTIDVEPFRLNEESERAPSEFEVIFCAANKLYRYGFSVNKERVCEEWLYFKSARKEIEVFVREGEQIHIHDKHFQRGKYLWESKMVRNNALFLSVAAQFNEEMAGEVLAWFRNLKIISGLRKEGFESFTFSQLTNSGFKKILLRLLQAADIALEDIEIKQDKPEEHLPKELVEHLRQQNPNAVFYHDLNTFHKKFDAQGNLLKERAVFSFNENESAGTQQFFSIAGPIIDVLAHGYLLYVDELDACLHPRLVSALVALFNSAQSNPRNAQLIFNTHYSQLLDTGLLRRDQIWFVEKNEWEEGALYSLSDFKGIRKNEPFQRNYLLGRYGAVPIIEDFTNVVYNEKYDEEKQEAW